MKDTVIIVDVSDICCIITKDITLSNKEITTYLDNVMFNTMLSILHNLGYILPNTYKDIVIFNSTYIQDMLLRKLNKLIYVTPEIVLTLRTVIINSNLHIIFTHGDSK